MLLVLSACASATESDRELGPQPLFRFGVLADVQYADKDTAGNRHYRSSLESLEVCVNDLAQQRLTFAIQLGDFIDEGKDSLRKVSEIFDRLPCRRYHVLGNHDFALSRQEVMDTLNMRKPYDDFGVAGWRFVWLDGMDVSVGGGWADGDARIARARAMVAQLRRKMQPSAQLYNGAIGDAQLRYLMRTLLDAQGEGERVVLFCHFPLVQRASSPSSLLLNYEKVLEVIESFDCVVAWVNGHEHRGGYAFKNGIHHLTLPGMVEAPERNAYGVFEVFEDRLVLRGRGKLESRVLDVRKAPLEYEQGVDSAQVR